MFFFISTRVDRRISLSNIFLLNNRYRFTLDDLLPMMNAVKQRAQSFDEWASRVTEVLEAKLDKKRSKFCLSKWI